MERYTRGFDYAQRLTKPCHDTPSTVSIPVGRWNVTQGSIRGKAHRLPGNAQGNGQHFSISAGRWNITLTGRVREGSKCQGRFKMQALTLCDANHEHMHNGRSVQGSVQWGDGGNVWEGSKYKHSHTATSKPRARAQQPVRSRVSSRGRWNVTHAFDSQESSQTATTHIAKVSIPSG